MGRGIVITGLTAVWLAGRALAAEAEAIPMTDGPNGSGRSLGAAWSMACPAQARLVGIRLYEDGKAVVGVEALCARLRRVAGAIVWIDAPMVAEPPAPGPSLAVAPSDAEGGGAARTRGHVLRASSDGVSRFEGSRAVLITVPRASEPARRAGVGGERITLRTGRQAREIVCPDGGFVQGLRTGTATGRRGGVVSVQLICTHGGERSELVGPSAKPQRKATVVTGRTQCEGGNANPHDGTAGRALIGTAESGRIVSLGLVCARVAAPGPVSRSMAAALGWMAGLTPGKMQGARRVYRKPIWYAGSAVAVCRDGSGRGYCAQASADRFCVTMNGSGAASFYVVGPYADDVIASGGKRCSPGACRAFQSITCAADKAGRG